MTAKMIVVMDDSALVLDMLRDALEAHGFQVRTAATLKELEQQLVGLRPDLFILDVQMPEMFGDDVAQVLRDVRAHRAPILLYSSVDESSLAARASDVGVEYVPKQAGTGVLVDRIRTLLHEGAS
jgi:DNA-binding response OmpR family regulator